ncbi:hypothetical protein YPPY66_1762, partial [Yersinia pestis PY-66]
GSLHCKSLSYRHQKPSCSLKQLKYQIKRYQPPIQVIF